jgi:hypothetical protein
MRSGGVFIVFACMGSPPQKKSVSFPSTPSSLLHVCGWLLVQSHFKSLQVVMDWWRIRMACKWWLNRRINYFACCIESPSTYFGIYNNSKTNLLDRTTKGIEDKILQKPTWIQSFGLCSSVKSIHFKWANEVNSQLEIITWLENFKLLFSWNKP